jgi:hypothetical protein
MQRYCCPTCVPDSHVPFCLRRCAIANAAPWPARAQPRPGGFAAEEPAGPAATTHSGQVDEGADAARAVQRSGERVHGWGHPGLQTVAGSATDTCTLPACPACRHGCLKRRRMNARRCSRSAKAQVALGALRQVPRDEKQWVRPLRCTRRCQPPSCVETSVGHRRHDGMETQHTRADWLLEPPPRRAETLPFRRVCTSARPRACPRAETTTPRIGIVKECSSGPRRGSLG